MALKCWAKAENGVSFLRLIWNQREQSGPEACAGPAPKLGWRELTSVEVFWAYHSTVTKPASRCSPLPLLMTAGQEEDPWP